MPKLLCLVYLAMVLLAGCDKPYRKKTTQTPAQAAAGNERVKLSTYAAIQDDLKKYFEKYEIKPAHIVNDLGYGIRKVSFEDHEILWKDTNDITEVTIDGDKITLDDFATLNSVWNDEHDSVSFMNSWYQIKLYKHKGRDLIVIMMGNYPCMGLGCMVNHFLVYDLKNRTRNFFGAFFLEDEGNLYDFSVDGDISYVSRTFNGDANDPSGSMSKDFIYEIFTLNAKGSFIQGKDFQKRPYQIAYTIPPHNLADTAYYRENWFQPVRIK